MLDLFRAVWRTLTTPPAIPSTDAEMTAAELEIEEADVREAVAALSPAKDAMLTLKLAPVPPCLGIYTVKGIAFKSMPERMRYLHPEAAHAFVAIAPWAVVSDMFRSPESSLQAVREGRGAQPPGYSAHNYGLAIDIDIKRTMENLGIKTKAELDAYMEARGWYCHRRDHVVAFEAWHYNYLGVNATVAGTITSDEVEKEIQRRYGVALAPDDRACQRMLAKLGMYAGEIDGIIGPRSREAIRVFERAWGLNVDGVLDAKTRRTLAYVSCVRG